MSGTATHDIEKQARMLAAEHREAESKVIDILWFRAEDEIRLVEVQGDVPPAESEELEPFHFSPSPKNGLTAPTAVAIIRPEEVGKLSLPPAWGTWKQAEKI